MNVKTCAIEALMGSDAVTRSPPIVQTWLSTLLTHGDKANSHEELHMYCIKYHFYVDELAARCNVTVAVIRGALKRLGIATVRHGRSKVVSRADVPRLESELRHAIDEEESVRPSR